MATLVEKILERALALAEGTPLFPNDLFGLGSRAAVSRALSHLVEAGQVLRVGRGLYVRRVKTRFGWRPPAIPILIAGLGRVTKETLVSSGAAAANSLGLTTQVPVRAVYLTSGRTRRLSLGRQSIELRHAPSWQLALPVGRAGQALRAIAWFGQERASEAVASLRGKLSTAEIQELTSVQGRLPTWVVKQVSARSRP